MNDPQDDLHAAMAPFVGQRMNQEVFEQIEKACRAALEPHVPLENMEVDVRVWTAPPDLAWLLVKVQSGQSNFESYASGPIRQEMT
jgi:hypothetical protein